MIQLSPSIYEFLNQVHLSDYQVTPIAPDASDRQYYRLHHHQQHLILMDSSKDLPSLERFLKVSQILSQNGFSAPQIYHHNLSQGLLILEDLGEQTIYQYLADQPQETKNIFMAIIDFIHALNQLTHPPLPPFDQDFFFQELSAFTTWYLPYIHRQISSSAALDFTQSWEKALQYLRTYDSVNVFVHKDLHTANLFWLPSRQGIGKIGVIDYQNAKSGSIAYDFVSLVNSSRFPLTSAFRQRLLHHYFSLNKIDKVHFQNLQDIFLAQRSIKILGNFTGIYQQKQNPHYLPQLPHVWRQIQLCFHNPLLADVSRWFTQHKINLP